VRSCEVPEEDRPGDGRVDCTQVEPVETVFCPSVAAKCGRWGLTIKSFERWKQAAARPFETTTGSVLTIIHGLLQLETVVVWCPSRCAGSNCKGTEEDQNDPS